MKFGEKLKETRTKVGLSQAQMAEKLMVSRQAVTKWETGKGYPDIENLKAIALLLNVSIDYLLDDGETLSSVVMKEEINLSDYVKTGKCRSKEDACVLEKYNNAVQIYPLVRSRKLTVIEWIADFEVGAGVFNAVDSMQDMTSYYLVQLEQGQLLVNVTKEFIISTQMQKAVDGKKFVIGRNQFKKMPYVLMEKK